MDYQRIIESFFSMLGRFEFDRSKTYIEERKEILHKLTLTYPHQLSLMTMLTTFSHIAEVEKNYHNQPFINQAHHSFLAGANFLRKAKSLKNMYKDIFHELQQLEQLESAVETKRLEQTEAGTGSVYTLNTGLNLRLKPTGNIPSIVTNSLTQQSPSLSSERDSPNAQVPQSPGSAFRNSFFRVLSTISSSSNSPSIQQASFTPLDPYSLSSSSGYEPPPNSSTTTPIGHNVNIREFSEELMSHFCLQLQNFIQARMDMIDIYEKLIEKANRKFDSIEEVAFRLSVLCRKYHKYFHHPLLAPIKEGMTLECESLMTLLRAVVDIQHWRFLAALYDLQDAHSKLNYWASSTFNKDLAKRRFKVTKTQPAPRLYEWLSNFKEFLIAKFTLYFHTTLFKSFPTTNFKNCCSKLSVDYYLKLSNFQRRIDAIFVAILYDVSNEKDFHGLGYNFPSRNYQQPQGKNILQTMLIIPAEAKSKLIGLQAEIYMITNTNQRLMIKDGYYQFHDNIKKFTYSLTKLDINVVLVIVCEGQKSERDAQVRSFSLEISNQLALMNILSP